MVEAGRCVEVRHRMAHCHACVDACPEGAITIKDNRISIRPELCVGCGTCASMCPTQALRTTSPSLPQLIALVDQLAPNALAQEGAHSLEFACEHATPSNASARIIVPALPYVDESVILHAAAWGFDTVALTSCNQGECMKPTLAGMPGVVAAARSLLQAVGSSCKVSLRRQKPATDDVEGGKRPSRLSRKRESTFVSENTHDAVHGTDGYSRRAALSDMASQMKTIVAETAAAEMRDHLGQQAQEPSLRQTLTDGQGNFLKFDMPRAQSLLDDLYLLNPEPTGVLETRGFAQVSVNADACSRCGMCMKFCPSGALQGEAAPIGGTMMDAWGHAGWDRNEKRTGSLSFRPSDCVGCHLCEVSCPLHCLSVQDTIEASLVFELEPIDLLAETTEEER